MRIPRVCLPALDPQVAGRVELDRETAHYLTQVLRLKAGHRIRVFDGRGHESDASLETAERRTAVLSIEPAVGRYPDTTPRPAVHLLQGIAKPDTMDTIVQKAVELGACSLRPVLCERSFSSAAHRGLDRRIEHWQGIVRAAAEQCGRNELLQIHPPANLDAALQSLDVDVNLRLCGILPAAESSARHVDAGLGNLDAKAARTDVALAIGPEGGFSASEAHSLHDAAFVAWSLGSRVLRCETAAIAGLAVIQARFAHRG